MITKDIMDRMKEKQFHGLVHCGDISYANKYDGSRPKNAEQVKRNPILEGLGDRRSNRQQSYRSRRLDRIGNAVLSVRVNVMAVDDPEMPLPASRGAIS